MGIKLPWFRANLKVTDEVQNTQLVGLYNYKFDSYFDESVATKGCPPDSTDGSHVRTKKSVPTVDTSHSTKKQTDISTEKHKGNVKSKNTNHSPDKMLENHTLPQAPKNSPTLNITHTKYVHINKVIKKNNKTSAVKQLGLSNTSDVLQQNFVSPIALDNNTHANTKLAESEMKTIMQPIQENSLQEVELRRFTSNLDIESHKWNDILKGKEGNRCAVEENNFLSKDRLSSHSWDEETQEQQRQINDIVHSNEQRCVIPGKPHDLEYDSSTFNKFHDYDEFDS